MQRYAGSTESTKSAEQLRDIFKNVYLYSDVALETFQTGKSPNIVVTKPGESNKDSIFILCGHYDVYAQSAPGADDNGSGAALVIEVARLCAKSKFKKTIIFILFSAEESGLQGSAAYAKKAATDNKIICGVNNVDVALFRWDNKVLIEATYDTRSTELFKSYIALSKLYIPSAPTFDAFNSPHKESSDNKSFWSNGFKALMTNTQLDGAHPVNPLMHTMSDVIGSANYCMPAFTAVAKAAAASLATWAELIDDTKMVLPQNNILSSGVQIRYDQLLKKMFVCIPAFVGEQAIVRIVDGSGRSVSTVTDVIKNWSSGISLDLSKRAAGVYYVSVVAANGKGELVKKLVIMK
jgi:Zn-dependent M28 family amino/carboxypeptidase